MDDPTNYSIDTRIEKLKNEFFNEIPSFEAPYEVIFKKNNQIIIIKQMFFPNFNPSGWIDFTYSDVFKQFTSYESIKSFIEARHRDSSMNILGICIDLMCKTVLKLYFNENTNVNDERILNVFADFTVRIYNILYIGFENRYPLSFNFLAELVKLVFIKNGNHTFHLYLFPILKKTKRSPIFYELNIDLMAKFIHELVNSDCKYTCVICLEDIYTSDITTNNITDNNITTNNILKPINKSCRHFFHRNCVLNEKNEGLLKSSGCPLCKAHSFGF